MMSYCYRYTDISDTARPLGILKLQYGKIIYFLSLQGQDGILNSSN